MGAGRFSDHRVQTWLAQTPSFWIACHFDNPEMAGAYASEIFGGSYERVRCEFSTPTARGIFNITPVTFVGLPVGNIAYIAGWDSKTAGNMEWLAELDKPMRVQSGASWTIPQEKIVLSID